MSKVARLVGKTVKVNVNGGGGSFVIVEGVLEKNADEYMVWDTAESGRAYFPAKAVKAVEKNSRGARTEYTFRIW